MWHILFKQEVIFMAVLNAPFTANPHDFMSVHLGYKAKNVYPDFLDHNYNLIMIYVNNNFSV